MNNMNRKIKIEDLPLLPSQDNDNCFGCSTKNKHGLQMKFHTSEEYLYSKLIVPEHLSGWSNLVHGGILSTILDEIMGWSAIYFSKKLILTKSMNVEYKQPLHVGDEITARGSILEMPSEREALMMGELLDENGEVCVVSKGDFALFTPEAMIKMGIMSRETVEGFMSFMNVHQEAN